jgi:predicted ATPase
VVHQKTGGIIMFVLRLLTSLYDESLVWYCMSSHRWKFDLQKIEMKEMSGDVVQHMTEQMSRLPSKTQMGLKLCSCLGPNFDAVVLEKARKGANIGDKFLESCVDDGFLQAKRDSSYTWAHDQVQQAAYELIPLHQREKFHLLIGSRLFLCTSPSEMETFIFYIVDNINRGANLVDNAEQKYEVAELNLRAGEIVLERQSFHSSVKYLMTGIALLENDSWEKKYSLTIRLYDAGRSLFLCLCSFVSFKLVYSNLTVIQLLKLYVL